MGKTKQMKLGKNQFHESNFLALNSKTAVRSKPKLNKSDDGCSRSLQFVWEQLDYV